MINQITHGDCLEVMREIPDGSVDMILCDLPYGTTACKWDTIIPFEPLWEQYERVIKDNGAIVLFGTEPFSSCLRTSNLKHYKYDWKWDKVQGSGSLLVKRQPLRRYEDVMVFYQQQPSYNPQMEPRDPSKIRPLGKGCNNETYGITQREYRHYDKNFKFPTNKLEFHSRKKELNSKHKVHPTQKPVALFEYLIKTYTNEGELVLDNCIGSGTTAIACINTGRNFIGIEKEQKYVELARKRIKEHKVQLRLAL